MPGTLIPELGFALSGQGRLFAKPGCTFMVLKGSQVTTRALTLGLRGAAGFAAALRGRGRHSLRKVWLHRHGLRLLRHMPVEVISDEVCSLV